jgi:hypothetical protein
MARQEVDIGIEGNDGTGDSIRESFKKVNENFTELYAIFGLGGAISFTNLDDVPDSYSGNAGGIMAVNSTETGMGFFKFVSDTGTNGTSKSVNTINNSVVVTFDDVDPAFPDQSGTVKVVIHDPHVERDPDPTFNASVNAQAGMAYNNNINTKLRNTTGVGDDVNTLVNDWNTTHPGQSTPITSDNIIVSKGYTDDTYVNTDGDELTGLLQYDTGVGPSQGRELPATEDVITRAGSEENRRMLDTLYLADHPSPLEGFGTPNGKDDLQAVTKLYADTQGFASATNLYVATTGDDRQATSPAGKEGRSPQYAYASINAAMQRAEQIIDSTPFEPGPYVQVITYDAGEVNSTIDGVAGYVSPPSTADVASDTAIDEVNTIQEAISDYLAENFPDLVYDQTLCFRDTKLIIDSVRLDVLAGTSVNYLSRYAGLRYNANPSALVAKETQGRATRESIALIRSSLVTKFNELNTATPGTISTAVITAYTNRLNEIIDILNDVEVALAGTGPGYTFTFTNGTNDSVDQGVEGNPDLIEGKIIVGRTSGAKGIITDYTRTHSVSTDQITVDLVEPIEFIEGEELEYGNQTKNNQITVRVESGVYYEHLPIKLPENVSIKGDEFRRVVLRPKPGVSQSKWASTYFYRDIVIDGLIAAFSPILTVDNVGAADASRVAGTYVITADDYTSNGKGTGATFSIEVDGTGAAFVSLTAGGDGFAENETLTVNDSNLGNGGAANLTFDVATTGGGFNFTHPINGKQGKYGYHYLIDPSESIQVGTDGENNPGNFNDAARIIELNKQFIIEETIAWINVQIAGAIAPFTGAFTYNEAKCRRDTGLIIDGIIKDLREGGREATLTNQGAYFSGSVAGQEDETSAAILNLVNIMDNVLDNDSAAPYTPSTGNTEPQVFDTDYTPDAAAAANMEALVNCVDAAFDTGYNPPLKNSEMDVFLCNDATIVRNITVQRHGGFMMVLDPEGQILTRSPYCQTGSSFSQSKGTNRNFAGGLFADGYAGNMPMTVDTVNSAFNLSVSSPAGEGLFVRRPPTPFPFFYNGARYQVNTITNYDKAAGTCNLILDETSNPQDVSTRNIDSISQASPGVLTLTATGGYSNGDRIVITNVNGMTEINGSTLYVQTTGDPLVYNLYTDSALTAAYDTTGFSVYTSGGLARTFATGQGWLSGTGIDIFAQSGGNRSMLANDFTQVNDLGFGALLVNNALAELVSMFTYYCHTGYLALDGSQIRSLGGNNSYGVYGMVAEGSDPDEIATDVALAADMVFPAKVFRADGYLDFSVGAPVTGLITPGDTLTQGQINANISLIDSDSTTTRVTFGAAHGLTTGDQVTITDVLGMIEINDLQFFVEVLSTTEVDLYTDSGLTVPYDSSLNTAYTSGGEATREANATGIYSFGGEEDGSGNPTRLYIHTTTGTFNTTSVITANSSTNVGTPTNVETLDNDAADQALFLYAYDLSGYPNNVSEVEILHATGLYQPYEVTNSSNGNFILSSYEIDTDTVTCGGTYTADDAVFTVKKTHTDGYSVVVDQGGTSAAVGETIIIPGASLGGSGTGTGAGNDLTIEVTDADGGIISAVQINAGTPRLDDSTPVVDGQVWRFNFGTGLEGTAENGLQEDTVHDTKLVFRHKQNFLLDNFPAEDLPVRPSTAFQFVDDTTEFTYRTIAFGNQITDGVSVGTDQRMVTFDSNFRYIDLTTVQDTITVNETFFDANSTVDPNYTDIVGAVTTSNTITMGATAATTSVDGSRFIVINTLGETDRTRLANADMLFTWGGKQHRITAYAEYNYTGGSGAKDVAVIQIVDTANTDINFPALSGSAYGGLGATLVNGSGITLKAGLASGENAEITVNISTTRATGHDMLDIGTGGFNTSNYPERIFGEPFGATAVSTNDAIDSTGNASAAQVQERNKGRVFTVMTDQDGFFRVGRFFTVDQGTGSVTFNAALVLTNIDGIGFKRGVRVNEFSNDDTFTDAKGDAVPTQTAVEGYIDQRLGFDRDGITGGPVIGPGVMSLGGPGFSPTPMNGDMNLGSNRITNLATPIASSDAVTKQYVDQLTDELNDIGDVSISGTDGAIQADILAFIGTDQQSQNVTMGGDIGLSYDPASPNTITAFIQNEVIVNGDVSPTAAIAQSKLDMNAATTRAGSGGITQADLGLASFNSTEFDATSGWIALATGGIANGKLANDDITIGTTTIALGGSSTSLAGMTGITFTSGSITGTVNINIAGSIDHTANIQGPLNSGLNNGVSIGASTRRYDTIFASTFNGEATSALYADLAENYLGDADYEPGTVLVFGGDAEVTECAAKGQTSVAGVVTTNPAHLMNSALEGDNVVGLALQGRVPCKVIGRVAKGDMLVTSAVPGYAIVNNSPGVGQVLGKAVGTKDDEDRGIVEIVVGRV